jgi:hypothetical protein
MQKGFQQLSHRGRGMGHNQTRHTDALDFASLRQGHRHGLRYTKIGLRN